MGKVRKTSAEIRKTRKRDQAVRHYQMSKTSERSESAYKWFKALPTDYGKGKCSTTNEKN